jgi:nucleotide-binding universal stress UspA family protein
VVKARTVDEAVTEEAGRGYDVVFLGLERPRALSHRLLRVLLASGDCDVVVVRAGRAQQRYRRILLPVTGAAPSRAAAELGFIYARETGAHLHLLHVIESDGAPGWRAFAEARHLGAQMLRQLVERGRRERVDVSCRLVSSRFPGRAILDAAVDERAELILVGATPRLVERRAFLGPMPDLVLAHARCAVAIYVGGLRPEALRAASAERSEEPAEAEGPAPEREGEPLH